VHAAHVRKAEQDKLLGEGCDFFVQTNNLLVKTHAVGSPFSPKDDEKRLVLAQRLRPGLGIILQPDRSFFGIRRLPNGTDAQKTASQQAVHGRFPMGRFSVLHRTLWQDWVLAMANHGWYDTGP